MNTELREKIREMYSDRKADIDFILNQVKPFRKKNEIYMKIITSNYMLPVFWILNDYYKVHVFDVDIHDVSNLVSPMKTKRIIKKYIECAMCELSCKDDCPCTK